MNIVLELADLEETMSSEVCTTCGGMGRVGQGGPLCPICAGSGLKPGSFHPREIVYGDKRIDEAYSINNGMPPPCPVCTGTGFVEREGLVWPCDRCGGVGRVS